MTGYGDDGSGDNGDDWQIMCNDMTSLGATKKLGEIMYGDTLFFLKHVDSDRYLMTDNDNAYTNQNCPRCPIVGHNEISAARAK